MTKKEVIEILLILKQITDAYADLINSDYATRTDPNPANRDDLILEAREILKKYNVN